MRIRRRKSKTSDQLRAHVRRRAKERFGLYLTDETINDINRTIQRNLAVFYDRQSNIVTRWICRLGEEDVAVAYDKKRKCIRTVMPVTYLTRGEDWEQELQAQHRLLQGLSQPTAGPSRPTPKAVKLMPKPKPTATTPRPTVDTTGMLKTKPFAAFFEKEQHEQAGAATPD